MSDNRHFIFAHDTARRQAAAWCMNAPEGYHCRITEPSRTLDQNAYQWPYLEGFSKQLQWPVNGVMVWMTPDEYKDVLTCAFEEEVKPRLAMGWDGGIVMLGRRTSQFGKKKFALWMEWLMAAAALKGIEPVFKDGEHKRWIPEAARRAA
jgi:hypothetical protein